MMALVHLLINLDGSIEKAVQPKKPKGIVQVK